MGTELEVEEPSTAREAVRSRLQAKRDFISHLVAYAVVNALLVGVWAVTGRGYFWPVWVIAFWGAGLIMHAWDAYFRRPVTESEVDAELERRKN